MGGPPRPLSQLERDLIDEARRRQGELQQVPRRQWMQGGRVAPDTRAAVLHLMERYDIRSMSKDVCEAIMILAYIDVPIPRIVDFIRNVNRGRLAQAQPNQAQGAQANIQPINPPQPNAPQNVAGPSNAQPINLPPPNPNALQAQVQAGPSNLINPPNAQPNAPQPQANAPTVLNRQLDGIMALLTQLAFGLRNVITIQQGQQQLQQQHYRDIMATQAQQQTMLQRIVDAMQNFAGMQQQRHDVVMWMLMGMAFIIATMQPRNQRHQQPANLPQLLPAARRRPAQGADNGPAPKRQRPNAQVATQQPVQMVAVQQTAPSVIPPPVIPPPIIPPPVIPPPIIPPPVIPPPIIPPPVIPPPIIPPPVIPPPIIPRVQMPQPPVPQPRSHPPTAAPRRQERPAPDRQATDNTGSGDDSVYGTPMGTPM